MTLVNRILIIFILLFTADQSSGRTIKSCTGYDSVTDEVAHVISVENQPIDVLSPMDWSQLDAVAYDSKGDKYHFFYGDHYVTRGPMDEVLGEPKKIVNGFKGFPTSWGGGNVDAVLYNATNDCYYFFKGNEYARKPRGKEFDKGPINIHGDKSGFKGLSLDVIRGACYNPLTSKYYFFDNKYFQSKERGAAVNKNVKTIGDKYWKGCPFVDGISGDVIFNPTTGSYYFFNNDGYAVKYQGEDFDNYSKINYDQIGSEFRTSMPREGIFQLEIYFGGYTSSAGTLENTGTKDNVTIRWYGIGDQLIHEQTNFDMSNGELGNTSAFLKTNRYITRVTISTNGEDGLWLDVLNLGTVDFAVNWGNLKGDGFCVSNDPEDANRSWKDFIDPRGCHRGWSFNVLTRDATPIK